MQPVSKIVLPSGMHVKPCSDITDTCMWFLVASSLAGSVHVSSTALQGKALQQPTVACHMQSAMLLSLGD